MRGHRLFAFSRQCLEKKKRRSQQYQENQQTEARQNIKHLAFGRRNALQNQNHSVLNLIDFFNNNESLPMVSERYCQRLPVLAVSHDKKE